MSLGQNIYRLRRSNRLSQEELALRIGVTRQAISKWELDETVPDTANLIALSDLFHTSIDDLIGRKHGPSLNKPNEENSEDFSQKFDQFSESAGKIAKKHWAKIGYYLIYISLPLSFFGLVASMMASSVENSAFDFGFTDLDGFYMLPSPTTSPVSNFTGLILGLGILLFIAGIALVFYDRSKNAK